MANDWYKDVPKDLVQNLKFRKMVLERAVKNPLFQQGLIEICRADPIFFINTFIWQHNPNRDHSKNAPFICYPFQEDAIRSLDGAIADRHELVVEKSRELGASWLVLMAFLRRCLFFQHNDFLCLSKTEDDVTSDSPNSLFWKIRYMIDRLPKWMTGPIRDRSGFIAFDRTRSTISGVAPTAAAGVGGRCTAILLDEFQKMVNASAILEYTSDISRCRIFVGTHTGDDTAFYQLCYGRVFKKIVIHWSHHPEKNQGLYKVDQETGAVEYLDPTYQYAEDFRPVCNGKPGGPFPGLRSPWYDYEVTRRPSERDVAMNLDIDPKGAADKFFDTLKIEAYKRLFLRDPVWEGNLEFSESGRPMQLVRTERGPMKLWINPKIDGTMPRGNFGVAADIGSGVGSSPSTICAMNLTTGEKILEYSYKHILPKDFANLLVATCYLLLAEDGQPAYLNWEANGGGGATVTLRVRELGFGNIYFRQGVTWSGKTQNEPGFHTTPASKMALLSEYRDALWSHKFINPSAEAIEECHKYKYVGDTVEHAKVKKSVASGENMNHGDLVMADAMCWWIGRNRVIIPHPEIKKETPVMSLRWRREQAAKNRVDSWYPTE
jgi:hypothetical protein